LDELVTKMHASHPEVDEDDLRESVYSNHKVNETQNSESEEEHEGGGAADLLKNTGKNAA